MVSREFCTIRAIGHRKGFAVCSESMSDELRKVEFRVGSYTAYLLPSKAAGDTCWYVVVQPRYSRDIVAIDRHDTYEAAKAAVMRTLNELNQDRDQEERTA